MREVGRKVNIDQVRSMKNLGQIVMEFADTTWRECLLTIDSHAQNSFCILSARFLEICESAVILASKGYHRQSDGIMRSALEGLAHCAILARRPEFVRGVNSFELADRYDEFEKLRDIQTSSSREDLSEETLRVNLDDWEQGFEEQKNEFWDDYIIFHKRFVFESSRNWKPYDEEAFTNFRNYIAPQIIKKPDIWKLYQFGRWLPEAMKKLDIILHNASVNSHFNFSTLGSHVDEDQIRKERGVVEIDIAIANVIEIVFLWFALVDECFALEISANVESLILRKEKLLTTQ